MVRREIERDKKKIKLEISANKVSENEKVKSLDEGGKEKWEQKMSGSRANLPAGRV